MEKARRKEEVDGARSRKRSVGEHAVPGPGDGALALDPLIEPADQSRAWAAKLVAALAGSMLMWTYVEPAFVAAGIAWREAGLGLASYLVLSALLIAAAPAAAYLAASRLGASNPAETARWASWPALILLVYHWAMSSVFSEAIRSNSDFGFIQFCNTGAWAGAFTGFFGGLAFEPSKQVPKGPAFAARLRHGLAGAALVGLAWSVLGSLIEFSWRNLGAGLDSHFYMTVFLMLGLPFFCAGLAEALGDARGGLVAAWAVPPTFAALYFAAGGSAALIDPARADVMIGRLPEIALAQGAAAGLLCGAGYRRRSRG